MKRIAVGVGVTLGAIVLGAGVAVAATNSVNVHGNTDHSIYKFGKNIDVTGKINGDVICAGQTVTIDAKINGDVICAAQTLTINGEITGDVRVAGQTVTIGAKINHSTSVVGQDASLDKTSYVGRDVGIAAKTATLDGKIGRDIRAGTERLTINNVVGRNVEAHTQKLLLSDGANIKGNITYTSPEKLIKNDSAKIGGQINYHKSDSGNSSASGLDKLWFVVHIFWIVITAFAAVVLAALFPQLFVKWNKRASEKLWRPLLIGFVAMFAVPALIVALFASLVGSLLALLLVLLWLAVLFLSGPIAAYYIGDLVMRGNRNVLLIMLSGAVLLSVLEILPIVGGFAMILALWFGSGSLLLNLQKSYKKPNYKS